MPKGGGIKSVARAAPLRQREVQANAASRGLKAGQSNNGRRRSGARAVGRLGRLWRRLVSARRLRPCPRGAQVGAAERQVSLLSVDAAARRPGGRPGGRAFLLVQ